MSLSQMSCIISSSSLRHFSDICNKFIVKYCSLHNDEYWCHFTPMRLTDHLEATTPLDKRLLELILEVMLKYYE